MSCGPDDMIVSTSVPLAVPADWAAAAAAIDLELGPVHGPLVRVQTIEP